MSISIKATDIRGGDKIRAFRIEEYTVDQRLDEDYDIHTKEAGWIDAGDFERFELISRAHPKVPTEHGSVLRVKDLRGKHADGTWLVKTDGNLVSAAGIVKSPEDFLDWLDRDNFTFEVIA